MAGLVGGAGPNVHVLRLLDSAAMRLSTHPQYPPSLILMHTHTSQAQMTKIQCKEYKYPQHECPPPKHFYKYTNTLLISKEFYSLSSILEGIARAGYLVTLLPGNPCRASQETHRLEWAGPLSHVLRIPDQTHDSPPSPTLLLIHSSPTSCWPEQQPAN